TYGNAAAGEGEHVDVAAARVLGEIRRQLRAGVAAIVESLDHRSPPRLVRGAAARRPIPGLSPPSPGRGWRPGLRAAAPPRDSAAGAARSSRVPGTPATALPPPPRRATVAPRRRGRSPPPGVP